MPRPALKDHPDFLGGRTLFIREEDWRTDYGPGELLDDKPGKMLMSATCGRAARWTAATALPAVTGQ
jgi:hypothetical protein